MGIVEGCVEGDDICEFTVEVDDNYRRTSSYFLQRIRQFHRFSRGFLRGCLRGFLRGFSLGVSPGFSIVSPGGSLAVLQGGSPRFLRGSPGISE